MATAREIRASLRQQEKAKLRKREDAVVAVLSAGKAVAKELTAVEARKEELRQQLVRDLAALDAKVTTKEVAAGEAVQAAMGGELAHLDATWRESDLHRLTGFAVADMRRWLRQARQKAEQVDGEDPAAADGVDGPAPLVGGESGSVSGAITGGPERDQVRRADSGPSAVVRAESAGPAMVPDGYGVAESEV